MSDSPNVILIDPAIFGTLIVGLPDLMMPREMPKLFKPDVSGSVIAVTMGADDLNIDLQFLPGNDMHRAMLISADIIFGTLTAGDVNKIEDILADTDFEDEQLDDVTAGTVTFKLINADGTDLPEGGISLDSIQAQVQKFGMVLKALLELPSGESNQWQTYIGQPGIAQIFGLFQGENLIEPGAIGAIPPKTFDGRINQHQHQQGMATTDIGTQAGDNDAQLAKQAS